MALWGGLLAIGLATTVAWAQTTPAKGKLERLKIAVAPLRWDTNFTWLQSRSGQLDRLDTMLVRWFPQRAAADGMCNFPHSTRFRVVSLNCCDEVLSVEYHNIRASQGMKVS